MVSRADRSHLLIEHPAAGQWVDVLAGVGSIRIDTSGHPEAAQSDEDEIFSLQATGTVARIGDDFLVVRTGTGFDLHVNLNKVAVAKGGVNPKVGDLVTLPAAIRQSDIIGFAAVPLEANVTLQEKRFVERALTILSPIVLAMTRQRRQELSATVLREFTSHLVPSRIDIEAARLRANAQQWVFQGTQWMTAGEVAELAGVSIGTVNRWKNKHEIFAISHQGRDLYPQYAFNTQGRPLPVMGDILAILADSSPDSIAAWFESTSSFLGGRRPRELLHDQPDLVRSAARNSVNDEQYAG